MENLDKLRSVFAVRWPDFKPEEVLSPDGLGLVRKGDFPISLAAMDKLQAFRTHLGKPFKINQPGLLHRGFRSLRENFAINKWTYSYHCAGIAFDVTVPGLSMQELHDEAKKFGFTGLGLYSTWVHMDVRPDIVRGRVAEWAGK